MQIPKSLVLASRVLCILLLVLSGTSCTPHRVYRAPAGSIVTSIPDLATVPNVRASVRRHNIELHPQFTLGFIEFDDQGEFWSRDQLSEIEKTVREESRSAGDTGVLLVVFVHGWKHNADVCDENVSCLREILKSLYNLEQLQAMEAQSYPRRIVGVYAGWRGLSVTPPVLKELSFYARKATAHRIGQKGEVLELLTRLELLRDSLNAHGGSSRLVVVGHSFGAALVYSALSGIFVERLARSNLGPAGAAGLVQGFGDLVVLVNPAFEAGLYSGIHALATSRQDYSPRQPAVLLVVSSETDRATGSFFPLGRSLSTLFQRTRSPEQKQALTMSLGHFGPFRTHRLERTRGSRGTFLPDIEEIGPGAARGSADCRCSFLDVTVLTEDQVAPYAGISRSGEGGAEKFGGATLHPTSPGLSPYLPFLVVEASDEIVTQHNGIYNKSFLDFLRAFLAEMERRRASPPPA